MSRFRPSRYGRSFFVVVAFVMAILAYGAFEARRLIAGPEISILSPLDGTATSSASIVLSGEAKNISFLTINDQPALTDESGRFSESLSPAPGYAIFTVSATDRFGRHVSRSVRITILDYCPLS